MFEIIVSNRNVNQIIYLGFLYAYKRTNKFNVVFYCIVENCPGKNYTVLNYEVDHTIISGYINHNHEGMEEMILRRKLIEKMKAILITHELNPREAINYVLRGESSETIRILGSQLIIARTLRRYVAKMMNPRPYLYEYLKLSENLCKTYSNETFFQYGVGNYRGLP